jgi:hypothetical protein
MKSVQEVQDSILKDQPLFTQSVIPVKTLHVTLFILTITSDEALSK